jgi:hypothetical protein
LRGHTNNIYALAFSPDGKTLASGSMDQTVKLWDTVTGALRETIVPGESGTSSGMGAGSAGGASIGSAWGPRLLDRDSAKPSSPSPEIIESGRVRQSELNAPLLDQSKITTDQLLQTEVDLIDAESKAQAARAAKAELIKLLDKYKEKAKAQVDQPAQGTEKRR